MKHIDIVIFFIITLLILFFKFCILQMHLHQILFTLYFNYNLNTKFYFDNLNYFQFLFFNLTYFPFWLILK